MLYGNEPGLMQSGNPRSGRVDTLRENQILYKGKMWRNNYSMVKGDQFLFSREYQDGAVTINGKIFSNILLNYDIYNDEILTPKGQGIIIQVNKEMVDNFAMVVADKLYTFINAHDESLPVIKGFVRVLYQGKSSLYVKYKKEIEALAVDDKYDLFFRTYRIYLVKDGKADQITSKHDLFKILNADKSQLKDYIKKNKLKISKMDPESFVPVIRFYDSLSR